MENKNLYKNNKSGTTGVRFDKSRNKWLAEMRVKNKAIFIGRFATYEEAVNARQSKEKEIRKGAEND